MINNSGGTMSVTTTTNTTSNTGTDPIGSLWNGPIRGQLIGGQWIDDPALSWQRNTFWANGTMVDPAQAAEDARREIARIQAVLEEQNRRHDAEMIDLLLGLRDLLAD